MSIRNRIQSEAPWNSGEPYWKERGRYLEDAPARDPYDRWAYEEDEEAFYDDREPYDRWSRDSGKDKCKHPSEPCYKEYFYCSLPVKVEVRIFPCEEKGHRCPR